MKNLLILIAIPLFFISCVRDNDGSEQNNLVSFDVSMSIPSFGVYGTDKSANSQAAKYSSFQHIFKDEIDVVFTSTTTDFTATLTINPNDLSNTPSIDLAYGTYSWTISTNLNYDNGVEYYFPEYLPVYGSGSVEVFSSNVSLDLLVDTNYGLVTVQKENIDSAKIILIQFSEKNLILKDNLYYLYSYPSDGLYLSIEESKYNTTIQTAIGETSVVRPKTHYNYILAFSDVDVNSITLKTVAFEQFDYYLQPTVTASCTLSFDVYKDSWVSTQANGVLTTTASSSVEITPVRYLLSSTCSNTTLGASITGLPEGLTLTYDGQNVATISGTPSSQVTGTYTYTLTGYNSNIFASATSSITVQGSFIVTAPQISSCEINVLSGSLSQTINVGDSIINIDLMSDDECSTAFMRATGLPSGLIFSQLSTQFYGDTAYRISGTPNAQAGTYTFVIDNSNWGGSQSISGTIKIDEVQSLTYVPDNNFEQTLIDLGYDDVLDDYTLKNNISDISLLNISGKGIEDLTGIEDFESLETLYFHNNNITSIDLSNNINLTFLQGFSNNNLQNIVFPELIEFIDISNNSLESLNLSSNINLKSLYNHGSLLSFIDLTNNDILEDLTLDRNPNLECVQISEITYNSYKTINFNIDTEAKYSIDCENPNLRNVYEVSANENGYLITGKDADGINVNSVNPTITIKLGDIAYFYINASYGSTYHYFHLKTSPTAGREDQISDVPSGTWLGTVSFKPIETGTYYYQSRNSLSFGGIINVVN